jgi:hypothetical protein
MQDLSIYYLFLKCNLMHYYFDNILLFAKMGVTACFKCGLSGHLAWQCPTRQAVPRAGNQNKPQGRHNFTYGKVNHMTSDEA